MSVRITGWNDRWRVADPYAFVALSTLSQNSRVSILRNEAIAVTLGPEDCLFGTNFLGLDGCDAPAPAAVDAAGAVIATDDTIDGILAIVTAGAITGTSTRPAGDIADEALLDVPPVVRIAVAGIGAIPSTAKMGDDDGCETVVMSGAGLDEETRIRFAPVHMIAP